MSTTPRWVRVASTADLDEDDVMEVSVDGLSLALYRSSGGFFATDGICTHEYARLCDGFVFDNMIECAKHQGRFDLRTGKAKGAPAHVPLRTYPVRVAGTDLEIGLGGDATAPER
jgi:3-phenylpropionate/trans-cinnamate dioxygenase ferredoxin subunit